MSLEMPVDSVTLYGIVIHGKDRVVQLPFLCMCYAVFIFLVLERITHGALSMLDNEMHHGPCLLLF